MEAEYSEQCKKWIGYWLSLLANSKVKLYEIKADYRKHNPNKPSYFVLAKSEREAKQRFKNRITWLDIYGCEVCDNDFARNVVSNPIHYIVF